MLELQPLLLTFFLLLVVFLAIGIIGYMYMFDQNFIDAFYSTSITITSLNLGTVPETSEQKVFLAFYTIISVLFYFVFISILVAFIILYHKTVVINGGIRVIEDTERDYLHVSY